MVFSNDGPEEFERSVFCCFLLFRTGEPLRGPILVRLFGETTSSVNCSKRPYGTEGESDAAS